MPERPDLRQIAVSIGEALGDYDRDTLAKILTHVFKEYVVEGLPPAALGRPDSIADLEGLSFAEVVTALQTQLDLPELGLFQVEGARVSVRAGGQQVELAAADVPMREVPAVRGPATSSPAPPPSVESPPPAPRASVAEAQARGRGDLAGGERGVVQAPPARRGLSVSGQAPIDAKSVPLSPAAQAARAEQARAASVADKTDANPAESPPDKTGADDTASVRFSLLELD